MTTNSIIKQKILGKIKKGQVKMRPKVYFVFKIVFFTVLALVVFLLSFFVVSFIIFTLKANGNMLLFGFGRAGLRIFFVSFPWLLAILAVLIVIFLRMIAKGHRVVYRKSFLYFVLGIILIILIGGFLFSKVSFHDNFFERAQRGRLPVIGPIYLKYGDRDVKDFYTGKVLDYTDEGFYIETACGKEYFVQTNDDTRVPLGKNIEKDDIVAVVGREIDGVVAAKGIKPIKGDMRLPRRCQMR